MNDDWRVHVHTGGGHEAHELAERLRRGEVENSLTSAAGDRVIVSADGPELFLYAGTREQASSAADAVVTLARGEGRTVTTTLTRWHPAAEAWEDADAPLPDGDAAQAAEHTELMERERAESAKLGYTEFEVRVECSSHRDTVLFADTLREAGIPSLRRWRYLLIGAADEDAAAALADRVTQIAPAGASVTVEQSIAAVRAETGPNPFAVLGGLGG